MKTVFVNPERCVGCRQCEFACAVAHSRSKDIFQASFESPLPRPRIHVTPGIYFNSSFPNKCRHCNPAPCLTVCPTGAISRSDVEFVMVDDNKCITCAMCAMVCPFDVITFNPSNRIPMDKTVAVKCDNCIERVKEGDVPACVEVCKVDALIFGDINDLVKQSRSRLSEAYSFAADAVRTEETVLPELFEMWRAWGRSASKINERDL